MIPSVVERLVSRLHPLLNPLAAVRANTLEVRDLACLKKAFGWTKDPLLDAPHLQEFNYLADLNERRLRDAESLMTVCCNAGGKTIVEIGTATGHTTALMARNAPSSTVHTVNIPPDEIEEGGERVTRAFSRDDIGHAYREQGCTNVRQIFANTLHWEPDVGTIDVAFIDGCHDTDFVFNDTRKVLAHMKPGSFVLWHDFNPELVDQYEWIKSVCLGVERLYERGLINGRILHMRDSWVGIYQVPK
ncbi:MAG TPA: class I SAM-dependent methyltransferase [Kofleriaceae bacterium]|jgi:predicted O-methyltransferase YrrM|nr:class I SAM-dependent methyltransferase [Kofleriaceae bacterium]